MFSYVLKFVAMVSSSSIKRYRSIRQSKGKTLTTANGVPYRKLLGIEDVLNQTRLFNKYDKIIKYEKEFYTRIVLTPKIVNFPFFT